MRGIIIVYFACFSEHIKLTQGWPSDPIMHYISLYSYVKTMERTNFSKGFDTASFFPVRT